MKNFKSLLPFLLMLFVWAGCDTDDLRNDVDELKNRVESLEAQVSAINDNMNVLKVLTDGKQTIQSCVYDEASNSYKLVLSDNTELTLTQGKQGTVSYPQITISQNGTWVINGEDTGEKAVGDNAPTPEFAIDANGYWTVDFGNGATQVLGADGCPVSATTDGDVTVTDEFFKDVDVVNGELVVTLHNGEMYSLPIVEALVCDIQTENVAEFKNGVLTVGYGEEVSLKVVVKGDDAFVSAPAGWTAVLGEPDAQTNIAVLTLKAPAESAASTTLGRAATADNTKDLTVQVNKGVAWAVDKIQVEATKVISSYKALYDAGETITVNGIDITKAVFGEAIEVSSDTEITSYDAKVYFVKPGVTLTINQPSTGVAASSLIVMGDKPTDTTSKVVLKYRIHMNMTSKPTDADGYYIFNNVIFDAATSNTACSLMAYKNGAQDKAILFNACNIILGQKNFYEVTTDSRYFTNFTIKDCKIKLSAPMYLVHMNASKSLDYGTLSLINNILYTEAPLTGNGFKLVNSTAKEASKIAKLVLKNNTFVNVCPNWTGMYYELQLGDVDFQDNLFWASELPANAIILRPTNAISGTTCKHNVGFSLSSNTNSWIAAFGFNDNMFDGAENITNIKADSETSETNPFYGGTFDMDNGIFVPNATYAEYGAKFE